MEANGVSAEACPGGDLFHYLVDGRGLRFKNFFDEVPRLLVVHYCRVPVMCAVSLGMTTQQVRC